MVYEVVDNSIDEALAGFWMKLQLRLIKIILFQSQIMEGAYLQIFIKRKEFLLAEVIMTQHAGGKFDQNSYKVSGGLHGVGVSVVNALSEWLELTIKRDGKKYHLKFRNGEAEDSLKEVGKTENSGTEITFLPSKETFSLTEFDFKKLESRLRELCLFELRSEHSSNR